MYYHCFFWYIFIDFLYTNMLFLSHMGVIIMLRIAICDDSSLDLKSIKEMTLNLLYSLNLEHEILEYNNGKDLLDSPISFDLILLDIEMDNMDGITVARELRKYNNESKIIFITNSVNYLQVGYTVKAERYLVKPLDKQEFDYELTSVLKNQIIDNKFILDKRIGPYKLYLRDIIYIEFYDRKTITHKENEKISTYITLKEWRIWLDNHNFSQSHKAFLVNLKYIENICNDSVILTTNIELPLSRKFKDEFKRNYYIFIGERT